MTGTTVSASPFWTEVAVDFARRSAAAELRDDMDQLTIEAKRTQKVISDCYTSDDVLQLMAAEETVRNLTRAALTFLSKDQAPEVLTRLLLEGEKDVTHSRRELLYAVQDMSSKAWDVLHGMANGVGNANDLQPGTKKLAELLFERFKQVKQQFRAATQD